MHWLPTSYSHFPLGRGSYIVLFVPLFALFFYLRFVESAMIWTDRNRITFFAIGRRRLKKFPIKSTMFRKWLFHFVSFPFHKKKGKQIFNLFRLCLNFMLHGGYTLQSYTYIHFDFLQFWFVYYFFFRVSQNFWFSQILNFSQICGFLAKENIYWFLTFFMYFLYLIFLF